MAAAVRHLGRVELMSKPQSKLQPASDDGMASAGDGGFRHAQDDPHRLAYAYLRLRRMTAGGWTLRSYRDQWWAWDGMRYRPLPLSELRADVTDAIRREFDRFARRLSATSDANPPTTTRGKKITAAKVTLNLVSNVLQALQSVVMIPADQDTPCWLTNPTDHGRTIAMANGLVDIDRLLDQTGGPVLQRHTPDWFSPVCLPYAYQPDAECPQFLAFVREVLEGDEERITLLRQWFGYLLAGDTSLQKFLILVGEGANGKTVIIVLLTALLGEANVSTVPLELFGERFQLTATLGKLANLVPEVGTVSRVAEGFLKAFVAGDRMYFDRKNLPGIDARPTARLMLATNTLPPFADRSGGVWRRLMILPFRVTIPPDRQDPHLATALLAELPGIFNWATEEWRHLRGGRFIEPRMCRQVLEDFRIDSNPAQAFLLEAVRSARGSSIPSRELYDQYREWCDGHGHKPIPDSQFGKEVQRVFPRAKRRKTRGGRYARRPYHYTGIAWKPS
jgi:P4 family phage/plasmid primase-like protien